MLLEINNLNISIQARTLVEIEHLDIHARDRIGLIGKNGTGKTTLLRTISGDIQPEEGDINVFGSMEFVPQLKEQIGNKSGGEITQSYIQQAFSKQADLLLADEPTTHLDTEHIQWVEKLLRHWHGAFVIVSHDRAFLDTVCNKIWEIDQEKIHVYKGNYQHYTEQKEAEIQKHQLEFQKYQDKKQQLEKALSLKSEKAQHATKKPKRVNFSESSVIGSKPYFAKKQKKLHQSGKSIETRLEKLEKVDKPFEETPLKMGIPYQEKLVGKTLIRVENVSGKVGNLTLWKRANFMIKGGDKLAIVGDNGSGKTSLIRKIIANEEGIRRSPACQIAYFKQDLSILNINQSILENVQEGSPHDETLIRTVLARLHFFREDVYKKVMNLSGGERVKVTLAKLFLSNSNTLVLDEPTNFLDIEALEALESLLVDYEGTIIFVSHDRHFVKEIATKMVEIKNKQLTYVDGTYQDFKNHEKTPDRNDQLLIIETKITDVLSRLSLEPSENLEEEFQTLLKQKRALQKEK